MDDDIYPERCEMKYSIVFTDSLSRDRDRQQSEEPRGGVDHPGTD